MTDSHPSRPRPALDSRGLPLNYHFDDDCEITPRELHAKRRAGEDLVLIDCRSPDEYDLVHVEGAQLIPMQQFGEHVDDLRQLGDRQVVVMCHLGVRSLRVAQALRAQGIANARSLAGGIHLWALDIDPELPTY